MGNGKMPVILTVAALAFFAGTMLWLQPYSADFPGQNFAPPAQRFLAAAIRQDSAALVHLAGATDPVSWALTVARHQPGRLRAWAHGAQAWVGSRSADTTEVFVLNSSAGTCPMTPIRMRFVGSGNRARVVEASSRCFDPR
jgi:hypothetical protein